MLRQPRHLVFERHGDAGRDLHQSPVIAVDDVAARLGDALDVGEREDTAAHAVLTFQHQHLEALLLQDPGRLQAGETGSDDDHVRRVLDGPGASPGEQGGAGEHARVQQEFAAGKGHRRHVSKFAAGMPAPEYDRLFDGDRGADGTRTFTGRVLTHGWLGWPTRTGAARHVVQRRSISMITVRPVRIAKEFMRARCSRFSL